MPCRSGLEENNTETSTEQHRKSEKHLFMLKGGKPTPYCLFCRKQDQWSDSCSVVTELADRRKFFVDHSLCFNCGRSTHRVEQCRRRGCLKCKYKHHMSICDKRERERAGCRMRCHNPAVQLNCH